MFIFGHTHAAFLKRLGPAGQVVLNTGTWLKLLRRVPVRFGLLPAVYYPSYRLNYFYIDEEDNQLVIHYIAPLDLTRLLFFAYPPVAYICFCI